MRASLYNKYDFYIVLLISSLAFGGIGGLFEVSRVLSILLLPLFYKRAKKCTFQLKPYYIFFAILLGYSILSIIWAPVGSEYSRHALYVVLHFLLFFELIVFSRSARNLVSSITLGWLFAVALTLVVALWEITTDEHLPMSKQESDMIMRTGADIIYRQFASVTFYNYNTYVTFLCFAMPFLFCGLMSNNGYFRKMLIIVAIVLSLVCVIYNASRGGLLTLVTMTFVYYISSIKSKRNILFMSILGLVAFFVFYNYSETMFLAIGARAADAGLLEGASRYLIWEHALEVAVDYLFMGTGLGGIAPAMAQKWNGIVVPHNLLLESLVEFGFVIFALLIRYIVNLLRDSRTIPYKQVKVTVFIALAAFPFYSIIDSAYLKNPFAFVSFASLTAIVMETSSKKIVEKRVSSK